MNKKILIGALIALALGIIMLIPACTSSPSTTTTTPPTTTTTPPPTTTTTPPPTTTTTPPPTTTTTPPPTTTTTPPPTTSGQTYQTLANSGQSTYSSTCAVCHGTDGSGTDICPVVMWGSGSTLGTYNGSTLFTDAQGMLSYMSTKMPLTSPGSLSTQQYDDLLAFILLKNNLVSPSTVFDASNLSSISIP